MDNNIAITTKWANIKDITDEDYFINIDRQVRDKFPKWEVENMLPVAKMVFGRAEVPDLAMEDYPVEGYYYKTPELMELFKRVRNIQQNREVYLKVHKDDMLAKLNAVYDSDLFGTPPVSGYPWPDSPLKRRWDLLTHVMQSEEFDNGKAEPWTIPLIMDAIGKKTTGTFNLVELAALIRDPKLLTAAAETNALGRMFATMTGSCFSSSIVPTYRWLVRSDVEALGTKIVEAYNNTMGNNEIVAPHENNMEEMGWGGMLEVPRVAHLGRVAATKKNYFWILDYGACILDYYTTDFITTDIFIKNRKELIQQIRNRNN